MQRKENYYIFVYIESQTHTQKLTKNEHVNVVYLFAIGKFRDVQCETKKNKKNLIQIR